MNALIAAILAALPAALLRLLLPLFTEEAIAAVLRVVVVRGLRKAASLTQTTADDQMVEEVIKRLGGTP